jgi:ABC-type branched-subunit amino acid transport system substrate-binding protein
VLSRPVQPEPPPLAPLPPRARIETQALPPPVLTPLPPETREEVIPPEPPSSAQAVLSEQPVIVPPPQAREPQFQPPVSSQTAGPQALRAAILLPLSGPQAQLGKALLNAAQLALFEIAEEGFTLIPIDSKGTPEGAARAAQQAIDQGARLILGPLFSAEVKAAAPAARQAGVEIVAFSNDRTAAQGNVHLMGVMPRPQIERVVTHARNRGLETFAILAPASEFGRYAADVFRSTAHAQGGTVIDVEFYDPNAKDHSEVVKRLARFESRKKALAAQKRELESKKDEASIKALARLNQLDTLGDVDYDALFLPEEGGRLRAIAALLPYYDIDPARVKLIGTMLWEDPTLAAEPALQGGWFAGTPIEARIDFENRYARVYGAKPPRLASLAYDATALAAVLARIGDMSARAMANPNGFAGVDGIFRFLPDGTAERALSVFELQRNQPKTLSPAPSTFVKATN